MWTGLVGRGISVVYFPTLCVWSGVCVYRQPGPAGPMQAESRQMQSDTCVCRMVFVVTLWPQIIKCSPWGDSSRQAPQWNSLTQKEREGDGEIDESAVAEERKDGWKERQSASALRWVRKKKISRHLKWHGLCVSVSAKPNRESISNVCRFIELKCWNWLLNGVTLKSNSN